MGSPLRRSGVCLVICAALLVLLALAFLVHLTLLAGMRSDVASVFYRALALSSVFAAVPLTVLWFPAVSVRIRCFSLLLFFGARSLPPRSPCPSTPYSSKSSTHGSRNTRW
jgi:hypothetical protein